MLKNVGVIVLISIAATCIYQSNLPPPPRICGLPGGPPITASRVKLRDGRYLAYKEIGVPKENAKFKIVYVHGFGMCRHDVVVAANLPREVFEELGLYIVSFDRPGYGESDPDPKRTVKSIALDVDDLANQLKLGDKFYMIGYSMGGQTVWSSLKYIPHRLAGAALLAPVVNYWWSGFPGNFFHEAYQQQLPQGTLKSSKAQKLTTFPGLLTGGTLKSSSLGPVLTLEMLYSVNRIMNSSPRLFQAEPITGVRQQGEFESVHRDMMIGFGSWEFSPMNLSNPFESKQGSMHIWQGNEDTLVPVTLQRYIAQRLPWFQYHEVAGAGHLFPFAEGMAEAILRVLLLDEK